MLSNFTCVLIYSLTKCALEDGFKDSCVLKILQNLRNTSMTKFTVKDVTVFRVATFLTKYTAKYNFIRNIYGIYEIFDITKSTNLDCLK